MLLFHFYPLRFEFSVLEPLYFPPGKASNILRGALGVIFRRIACVPHCVDAKTCPIRDSCPYARVFEPTSQGEGPSGLADSPRPYVFRARHLDGISLEAGDTFWFGLNVFSLDQAVLAYFVLTFAAIAREGLGSRRSKAQLNRVLSGSQTLYDGATQTVSKDVAPIAIDLNPAPDATSRIRVEFLTPTELKHEHRIAERPEFPILFGRIRDRIATLSRLYAGTELDIDYVGSNTRAAAVKMTACLLRYQDTERRSTKTGQSHPIGGFLGEAEYEGKLAEFLPYLELARWTGVGRQSVWGKGEIRVERLMLRE